MTARVSGAIEYARQHGARFVDELLAHDVRHQARIIRPINQRKYTNLVSHSASEFSIGAPVIKLGTDNTHPEYRIRT